MGLSRTTALLDLSLTFPFDHFFFLLRQVSIALCVSSIHFHLLFLFRHRSLLCEMVTYPALEPACAAAAFWAISSVICPSLQWDYVTYLYS
jgi:hypothetical protein